MVSEPQESTPDTADHRRRRVVHFIFGLQKQIEPFHLLHYLAVASCAQVVDPDEIVMHVGDLPYGIYWDMVRPLVTVTRIDPQGRPRGAGATRHNGDHPELAAALARMPEHMRPYRYAHVADVLRLDVLASSGGMYADIDTLFVRPVPHELWHLDAVIGREHDVQYDDAPAPEESFSNALIMARPAAPFVIMWREQILEAMDGSWSGHSCRLATRIATSHPDLVHGEPMSSFSPFAHTRSGLRDLLEGPFDPDVLVGTYSVHLMEHLWWSHHRQDFSRVSACDIDEEYIRTAPTTLAVLARSFLPAHSLF